MSAGQRLRPARPSRPGRLAVPAVLALALLAGCATTIPPGAGSNPADPWEVYNRRMTAFNDRVDEAVLKPVAQAWRDYVPSLVRSGVGNALGNLRDLWSTANQFLQGKGQYGLEMGMRVLTNTVFGLGGLLDPATELGLTRKSEDFGQTLGVWGLGSGPYLVLPLLGPSTLRDTAGLPLDMALGPSSVPSHSAARYGVTLLGVVDTRAGLLSTTRLVDQVALDRYSFLRDAWLARRLDLVYDGNPPLESFDDMADDSAPPKPGASRANPPSAAASAASAAPSAASAPAAARP